MSLKERIAYVSISHQFPDKRVNNIEKLLKALRGIVILEKIVGTDETTWKISVAINNGDIQDVLDDLNRYCYIKVEYGL